MSQDLASLYIKVDSKGVVTASKDLNKLTGDSKKTETATEGVTRSFSKLQAVVIALASSYALLKMAQYVKDAALLAARYGTLGVVMRVVGNNAGYTGAQMEKFARGLQKTGIAMVESRNTLARMIQAQIDLTSSQKLARIAQDAAVIGSINSSEAFERMIYGLQTGMPRILRTIGLNVNFQKSLKKLADTLGIKTKALSEVQIMQARVNAVIKSGVLITGTYEAAMGTAGKKLTSFIRYTDDFKVKMGEAFGPATVMLVDAATQAMKDMQEQISRPEAQEALRNLSSQLAIMIVQLGQDLPKAIKSTTNAIADIQAIYNSFPEGVVGAAGAGLIGRILFGGWGPAKIVAGLYLINEGMSSIGTGLGDIVKSYKESVLYFGKAWDEITGKTVKGLEFFTIDWDENKFVSQFEKMQEMLAKGIPIKLDFALEDPDKYFGEMIAEKLAWEKEGFESIEKWYKWIEILAQEKMDFISGLEDEETRVFEENLAYRLVVLKKYYENIETAAQEARDSDAEWEDQLLRSERETADYRLSIWEGYNEDWQKLVKGETQFRIDEYAKDLDAYLAVEQAKTGMTDAQIKIRKQLMLNAYEDGLRKEKEVLNEVQEYWKHTFENIHDATADTFYNIFKNAEDGFRGLIENIKNWFLRLLAEMAAMALANPIKIIIGTIGGALGLPGMANAGELGGVASGIANWINQSPFGGTGLLTQWGSTWGNLLSYAGIAFNAIKAINAIGKGNYGQAAGFGIGTGLGAIFGGPIGAAIGGGIGGFIGGIVDSIFGKSNAGFGSSVFLSDSGIGKWGDLPSFGDWFEAAGAGGPASTELLEGFEKAIQDTLQGMYDAIDSFSARMPPEIRKKFEAALADIDLALLPHLAGMTDLINDQFYFVLTRENIANLEEYIKSIPAFILDQIAPALQDAITEWAGTFDMTLLKEDSPLQKLYDEILEGVQDGDWEAYFEKVDAFMNTMEAIEEIWAALNETIDGVLNPLNAFDAALLNLNAQFDQWIDMLEELGFTEEALAEIEAKRLLVLQKLISELVIGAQRELLGTTEIGALKDLAKKYGLEFNNITEEWAQSIIDAFTKMSTEEVVAWAESLGVGVGELVEDIMFLAGYFDLLGNSLREIGEDIRAMLSNISSSFGGADTAAMLMTQIIDLQSIPMAKMTGANLLSMSEKLVQWYQAAVSEEQERVRLLNEENRLLEQVVDSVSNLVDQIDQVIKNIKYSALNVSLPYQKAEEATEDYWTLYSAAKTGGTEDIQKYIGFVQTYLQQQQAEHKSSQAYQDAYTIVMGEGGHLREIQGMLEAGNYDQKIYNELKAIHDDVDADLSGIQATFLEFEGWILNALKTLEDIQMILTINWGEFEGNAAEVMGMLLELVKVYGWDNVIVLEWISNMAAWAAQDVEKAVQIMDQIADKSGGWETEATITFIASLAANLVNLTDAKAVLDHLVAGAGWDSYAVITFLQNINMSIFDDINALMAAIGYIGSGAGWASEALMTFILRLSDDGDVSWAALKQTMIDYGATDAEATKALQILYLNSQAEGWSWELFTERWTLIGMADSWATKYLKAIFDATGAVGLQYWSQFVLGFTMGNIPDATAEKILATVFQAVGGQPGIALWSDFKAAMENAGLGVDSEAWKTIKAIYNDQSGAFPTWNTLKYAMEMAGVATSVIKQIQGKYTSGDMTWTELENLLAATGTPDEVIRQIRSSVVGTVQVELTQMDFWSTNVALLISISENTWRIAKQLGADYADWNKLTQFFKTGWPTSWMQYFSYAGLGTLPGTGALPISFADGGISTGPKSGYSATLHGTELVVSPTSDYPATLKIPSNQQSAERPIDIKLTIELDGKPLDIKIKSISSHEADKIRVSAARRNMGSQSII